MLYFFKQREESIALVRYWAFTAIEDLRLIKSEVELLERFQGQQRPQQSPSRPKVSGSTQFPLLITKEKILATTFGAGYPSVPAMTLDQFVDLQVRTSPVSFTYFEKTHLFIAILLRRA